MEGITARAELEVKINEALQGKRTLPVSDDIWTREQLQAFSGLTANRGLLTHLFTTRNHALVTEHAEEVEILREETAEEIVVEVVAEEECSSMWRRRRRSQL